MVRTSTSAHSGADGDTMAVVGAFANRVDHLVAWTNELTKRLHAQVGKTATLHVIEWAPDTIRLSGCILLLTRLSNTMDTIRDLALRGAIRFPALSWVDEKPHPDGFHTDLVESIRLLESDVEALCVDLTFLVNGLTRRS